MMMTAQLKMAARIGFVVMLFTGLFVTPTVLAAVNDDRGVELRVEKGTENNSEQGEASSAPKKTSSVSTVMADNNVTSNLLQTTLGLLTVLALIAAAAWAVKRFGGFRSGAQGQMKIVGGLSVGTRERVVLLQVGEQQLVLGVSPGQIRTLHVLDKPLPSTDGESEKNRQTVDSTVSFASRFQTALKQNALKGMGGK